MVGRFVQKQDVRIAEQGLGQKHFDLQCTIQIVHGLIVKFGVHAQTIEKVRGVGFCFPAIHLREFGLEVSSLDAVFIRKILFHINGIFFFHHLIQPGIAHDYGIKNLKFIVFEMILLQEGQALSLRNYYISVRGLQLPGENLQEGGLAGSVRANQAIAVALRELNIYILE